MNKTLYILWKLNRLLVVVYFINNFYRIIIVHCKLSFSLKFLLLLLKLSRCFMVFILHFGNVHYINWSRKIISDTYLVNKHKLIIPRKQTFHFIRLSVQLYWRSNIMLCGWRYSPGNSGPKFCPCFHSPLRRTCNIQGSGAPTSHSPTIWNVTTELFGSWMTFCRTEIFTLTGHWMMTDVMFV